MIINSINSAEVYIRTIVEGLPMWLQFIYSIGLTLAVYLVAMLAYYLLVGIGYSVRCLFLKIGDLVPKPDGLWGWLALPVIIIGCWPLAVKWVLDIAADDLKNSLANKGKIPFINRVGSVLLHSSLSAITSALTALYYYFVFTAFYDDVLALAFFTLLPVISAICYSVGGEAKVSRLGHIIRAIYGSAFPILYLLAMLTWFVIFWGTILTTIGLIGAAFSFITG